MRISDWCSDVCSSDLVTPPSLRVDMLKRNPPRSLIATRQLKEMGWLGKRRGAVQHISDRQDEQTFAHLRDPVIGSIQDRVGRPVARLFERVADFLRDIVAAEIQDIRYILDDDY